MRCWRVFLERAHGFEVAWRGTRYLGRGGPQVARKLRLPLDIATFSASRFRDVDAIREQDRDVAGRHRLAKQRPVSKIAGERTEPPKHVFVLDTFSRCLDVQAIGKSQDCGDNFFVSRYLPVNERAVDLDLVDRKMRPVIDVGAVETQAPEGSPRWFTTA